MDKETLKLQYQNRINLLKARTNKENSNIIRKLERKLAAMG